MTLTATAASWSPAPRVAAVAGMVGSLLVSRSLERITPSIQSVTVWVWLAGPLVLIGVVAVASVLPARRALTVEPMTIARAAN